MGVIHFFILSKIPFTIEGIKNILKSKHIILSGYSDNCDAALKFAKGNLPGVLLIDDSHFDKQEFANFVNIILNTPLGTKTIIYTGSEDVIYLKSLINNGVRGLIHQESSKAKFFEAIELIVKGGVYYDNLINSLISKNENKRVALLSKREKEILDLVNCDMTNKEIAQKLFISIKTVENHKEKIKYKLELKSLKELHKN